MRTAISYMIAALIFVGCEQMKQKGSTDTTAYDTTVTLQDTLALAAYADSTAVDSVIKDVTGDINTRDIKPEQIVAFAQTLTGTPYKYASTDPAQGFDCSGFITYVFNHFKIAVPRSSVDFTDAGKEVDVKEARPGDLILFTGTDSTIRVVGHMGIVTENNAGDLSFIHSTSGKAYSVTTSLLKGYYQTRFVKVIRVFPDETMQNAR